MSIGAVNFSGTDAWKEVRHDKQQQQQQLWTSPVRICSAGGRHCGWGTWPWGTGSGSGCRAGALRWTGSGALCTESLLKYILGGGQTDRQTEGGTFTHVKHLSGLKITEQEIVLFSQQEIKGKRHHHQG